MLVMTRLLALVEALGPFAGLDANLFIGYLSYLASPTLLASGGEA
jgi:hypothetical protein